MAVSQYEAVFRKIARRTGVIEHPTWERDTEQTRTCRFWAADNEHAATCLDLLRGDDEIVERLRLLVSSEATA